MRVFIPKKILIIGAGILILSAGVGIGLEIGKIRSLPSAVLMMTDQKTDENVSQNKSEAGAVKVIRVIDGDTIEIEGGERVRYVGIDTPETVDPRKPVQCFGIEASNKNKELVEGKMARLEKDITDRDKYKRLLRYVWIDDILVNQALVEQGFAKSYSYPPDIKYQDKFVAAEKKARENKLGLWTACASETTRTTIITPSTTPTSVSDSSCVIKGNISASGEKIYHMQGCGSYLKTAIDESRGEKWFCTEADAQSAGWRKAFNCP